jgi:hypothetical protein
MKLLTSRITEKKLMCVVLMITDKGLFLVKFNLKPETRFESFIMK